MDAGLGDRARASPRIPSMTAHIKEKRTWVSNDLPHPLNKLSEKEFIELPSITESMNKFRVVAIALISLLAAALYTLPANQASGPGPAGKNVTFNKEISPILYKSCPECHRPGEAAPFSVLIYKDVRPWAKSIKEK